MISVHGAVPVSPTCIETCSPLLHIIAGSGLYEITLAEIPILPKVNVYGSLAGGIVVSTY